MRDSPYDAIAGMYRALWKDWYLPAAIPALERLLFSNVPAGERVLDLCCGCGHVTRELVARGYRVTGVDSSAGLIALARTDLPGVDFRVQDATQLLFDQPFQAVLSTFDSLNHILTLEDLCEVFAGVYRSLSPGGLFVFDMNLEQAYTADLHEWVVDVQDGSVGLVRGTFDMTSRRAATELIWFVRRESACWLQHRATVEEQCYPQQEIVRALAVTGFRKIEVVTASDAGMTSAIGFGRVFFASLSQE
jgi:ubiquinone/menaquinone biosynthesis C-methylase UbiE